MPIYEYTCGKCNAKFEQLVRSMNGAGSKTSCPTCGSDKTTRAMSVFAVNSTSAGKSAGVGDGPICGRCGGEPGSCER